MKLKNIPEDAPDTQALDEEQLAALTQFADLLTRVSWMARVALSVGEVRAIGAVLEEAKEKFD